MSLIGTCEIEREYFLAGLTVEQIGRHSVDAESFSSRAAITDHAHALYVNSSDAINVIARPADVRRQNVLTVAGSGDFACIFLYRNCKSLCLVDLSPFALFLCELKLRAIEALTYDEYRALFYVPQIYSNDYRGPFVCRSVYRRLREQLTAQARAFFDIVTDEEQHDLDTLGIAKNTRQEKLQARAKREEETRRMMKLYREIVLKEQPEPELVRISLSAEGAAPRTSCAEVQGTD